MSDNDQSLEALNNQQVIEKEAWDLIADKIREKVKEIQAEFGEAPPKYVHKRKGAGGEDWDYVRPEFFETALDKHCPDWSFVIDRLYFMGPNEGFPKPIVFAAGKLMITIAGVRRIIGAVGEHEVKFSSQKSGRKDEKGNDIMLIVALTGAGKSAETDCFKRCCVRALRLAHNIYRGKDEERNISPEDLQKLKDMKIRADELWDEFNATERTRLKAPLKVITDAIENPDITDRTTIKDSAEYVSATIRNLERRKK